MMAGERFSSRKRDFSCLGSVTGSYRDLSSPGFHNYRRDFCQEGTRRGFDSRNRDFCREGTKRRFDSRNRYFCHEGTRRRFRFNSREREIRSRGGFCFESNRARFDGGINHQRSSDHGSKKALVCHVEKPEDEKLLPFKKRMRVRFSIVLPEASKSTVKNLNKEFNLVGLPKLEARPLLLSPQLPEVEEGEIVEESWNMPPLVALGEGKIVGNCIAVKAEALIQRNKKTSEPVAAIRGSKDPLQSCSNLSEYELLNKINEGAYGVVYKAIEKKTGKIMALKLMKHRKGETGLPPAALREIKILFSLKHPSVLNVKEVVKGEAGDFFMAMEFMERDLHQFLNSRKHGLSTAEVKGLMLQLLEGVSYLHQNKVLHRDLKTSNLLLNNEGRLKICDFGLACRERSKGKPLTSLVVTLWYRAPELLLGAKQYSKEIDMWSVGCILAELLKKEPLFKGKSELDQLNSMVNVLGTPTVKNWPGLSSLPGVSNVTFAKQPENKLRQKFPVLSDSGLDLLQKLLTYNPRKRITAKSALNHSWFREFPLSKHMSIGVG